MSASTYCPACRSELAPGQPKGLCPRCALSGLLKPTADATPPASAFPARDEAGSQDSWSTPAESRHSFGDYELLGEIARGGMGVVYKARQMSLDRLVAVKFLLFGARAGADFIKRFRVEAEAAAALQHPHIVAIHEIGVNEGEPFLVMDYVDGPNLAAIARNQPLAPRRAAGYLKTIADAIHYAHEKGILHRDLKPSNVLIDSSDQPRVTDFGLAKRFGPESASCEVSQLTLSGHVLGSPSYLPPEQATGARGQLSRRSDVYSLGAMLYHLLTGRPPFLGDSVAETLRQVERQEPVGPRLLNPSVPLDLETICLKCLEKEPARRYATARELAEELDRFLTNNPIQARPIRAIGRFWRWCRRQPVLAATATTAVVLLLTTALVASIAAFRIERERNAARKAEREATERLWASYLAQARASRFSGIAGRRFNALTALSNAAAIRPNIELRNEALACLSLVDIRPVRKWSEQQQNGDFASFDQTLERYALFERNGSLSVRRTRDDQLLQSLPTRDTRGARVYQFSPDGRFLVTGHTLLSSEIRPAIQFNSDGKFPYPRDPVGAPGRTGAAMIVIWDLRTTNAIAMRNEESHVDFLDFSPDGTRLAIASGTKLQIVSLPAGPNQPAIIESVIPLPSNPLGLSFRPDGAALAAYCADNALRIVAIDSSEVLTTLRHDSKPNGVAWHPDNIHVAVTTTDRLIRVWNTREKLIVQSLRGHIGDPISVAFSRRGQVLASAGWDGRIRLWSWQSGQQLVSIPGGGFGLRFDPEDRQVGCHSWDGRTLQLFEVSSGREARVVHERPGGSRLGDGAASFDASGDLFAYSSGTSINVFDLEADTQIATWPAADIYSISAGGSNDWIVAGNRGLERWPIRPGEAPGDLLIGPPSLMASGLYRQTASAPRAGVLAAIINDSCDIFRFGQKSVLDASPRIASARFPAINADGQWLAIGAWNQRNVTVYSAKTGVRAAQLVTGLSPNVAFSADGNWLFTGDADAYRIWQRRGTDWAFVHGIERVRDDNVEGSIALSPDGHLLAIALSRSLVQLIERDSWREVASLESVNSVGVSGLAFSPDGSRLAIVGRTYAVQVLDLRRIREVLRGIGLDWDQPPYPPSPPHIAITRARVDQELTRPPSRAPRVAKASFIARPPGTPTNLVNLERYYNATLTRNWHGDTVGNDLSALSPGLLQLNGTVFDTRGLIQLGLESPLYPPAVSNIVVRQKCTRLHFLDAAIFGEGRVRVLIGKYVMRMENGQQHELPLELGRNIADWFPYDGDATENLPVAWTGENTKSRQRQVQIRLFKTTWENPTPNVAVTSIDFVGIHVRAAPFLIALTAEQ